MNWSDTLDLLTPCLPPAVASALAALPAGTLQELRLRSGCDAHLHTLQGVQAVPADLTPVQLSRIAEGLTQHGLYARSEETAMGYVTLRGGHRLGLCGQVHRSDGRRQLSLISSLCLRIAGEHPGCSASLLPHARQGLLIAGPPGSGKTTLLRDLTRSLSPLTPTAVIDERCELAACFDGAPQLDLGPADVLCGLGKADAVSWLIRSMCPRIIVTDEVADPADAQALIDAHACGAQIIASAHARTPDDIRRRPALLQLHSARVFSRCALLDGHSCGCITALFDADGRSLPLP